MDDSSDEGPVELVFYNSTTNQFAVFDNKRLRFEKKWHAILYTKTVPPPPKDLIWLYLVGMSEEQVLSHKRRVDLDVLLDLSNGVTEEKNLYELLILHKPSKQLYRPYIEEPALFGSKERALENSKLFLGEADKDTEYVVYEYKHTATKTYPPYVLSEHVQNRSDDDVDDGEEDSNEEEDNANSSGSDEDDDN